MSNRFETFNLYYVLTFLLLWYLTFWHKTRNLDFLVFQKFSQINCDESSRKLLPVARQDKCWKWKKGKIQYAFDKSRYKFVFHSTSFTLFHVNRLVQFYEKNHRWGATLKNSTWKFSKYSLHLYDIWLSEISSFNGNG